MKEITPQEAKSLVDRLGPHIKYDWTYDAEFPTGRTDVCVVRRLAENGRDYGFDTLYLLWKTQESLKYESLEDSRSTQDYIHIDQIVEDGKDIVIKLWSSSNKVEREYRRNKEKLGLE